MRTLFWFRRDLRLQDNAGLFHALKRGEPVLPIFIFDRAILDLLHDRSDARVSFIHQTIATLQEQLAALGSTLRVYYGNPVDLWPQIIADLQPTAVYTNHDYEPYALQRDTFVQHLLHAHRIEFHTFKDHALLEKGEVLSQAGKAYTVFTPYSRTWHKILAENDFFHLRPYQNELYFQHFERCLPSPMPSLADMGFQPTTIAIPLPTVADALLQGYADDRNFPAKPATSRLGIHLRFGTISIRQLAQRAQQLSATFLNELCWRDFYLQVLYHFPHVVGHAFKPDYDRIAWEENPSHFECWCAGETGYPIVDAGMRELNTTGFMHNRVRMIVASFLTKHLLLDWRLGEAYFAEKLLDFELASNNGGWQWAAGSGCDAAPYFRVFNPTLQMQKFDPQLAYVKRWVPEYGRSLQSYLPPIVDHEFARKRALDRYAAALKPATSLS